MLREFKWKLPFYLFSGSEFISTSSGILFGWFESIVSETVGENPSKLKKVLVGREINNNIRRNRDLGRTGLFHVETRVAEA